MLMENGILDEASVRLQAESTELSLEFISIVPKNHRKLL
jgi:hypothetical protein